jgi:hypothetical protein
MSSLPRRKGFLNRRELLKSGVAACVAVRELASGQTASAPARVAGGGDSYKFRTDLLDETMRDRLELIQLTTDAEVGGSHIYMEAQIFAPNSKRFVLQRSGHAHGSDPKDPNHQFLVCDVEDHFALHPLTDELGTTGPAVSPCGEYLYYFVDQTGKRGGRMLLNRVKLDGTDRRTFFVLDHNLPGTSFRPGRLYPLSTISSDGKRLAISARLRDEPTTGPLPYGLLIFDLQRGSVEVILHGPTWANTHPQYCRSTDPALMHDILIQENHHRQMDGKGGYVKPADPAGADIHVIRDDGTNFRDLPWGRDGKEFCQGHQCWRGQTHWAITSTQSYNPTRAELIESLPVSCSGHAGLAAAGGNRNILSREFPNPDFHHFATDRAGTRFITDAEPFTPAGRVMLARFGKAGEDPLTDWQCLARPRPSGQKTSHMHPFLSPDGRMAFFNSDESGRLQAYMIRGLS